MLDCPESVDQTDIDSVFGWTTCAVLTKDAGRLAQLVGENQIQYLPTGIEFNLPGGTDAATFEGYIGEELANSTPICLGTSPDAVFFEGLVLDPSRRNADELAAVKFLFRQFDGVLELLIIVSVPVGFEYELDSLAPCPEFEG